jgi:tRNA-2-methylthio-N6-dimethylallyladenosine synthase
MEFNKEQNTGNYIPLNSLIKNDNKNTSLNQNLFIETYGCQMNLADTEVVYGIMNKHGFNQSSDINKANIILLNTCSIREHAEAKIFQRLHELKKLKQKNPALLVGVIGCMAERLRRDLFGKTDVVDLVIGPDEYRKIPQLIENLIDTGEKGIAVRLSRVETYDDILPVRKDGISAWLSVMRGCDKFCSFCVVPFTRGRERSRNLQNIVNEVKLLWNDGFREVTLLGQNVNSYNSDNKDFADLLKSCSLAVPQMRIRFTTSHPQDLSVKLLDTIANYNNICKYIHLPVQSGSNRILDLMNRNYTIEKYLELVETAKKIIPDVSLSTDIISGFPTETDYDHKLTLDIMKEVRFDGAFMFKYSARENTKAFEFADDIDPEIKTKRLIDIIELQRDISLEQNQKMIGNIYEILIESDSKKSDKMFTGRTDGNKSVIVVKSGNKPGDKINVRITKANSATLFSELV